MCLSSITLKITNPTDEVKEGYKVVFIKNNLPEPCYYNPDGSGGTKIKQFDINTWLQANTEERIYPDCKDAEYYMSGFHIFPTLEAAKQWQHGTAIIKVQYRFVTCIGTEYHGQEAHVAREMFIPWPQTPCVDW